MYFLYLCTIENWKVRLIMARCHGQNALPKRGSTDCQSPHRHSPDLIKPQEIFPQQERNDSGHYSPRFGCQRSVPPVMTANLQRHQFYFQGMGTWVGRHSDAHDSHLTHYLTTTKNNISGSASANFEIKNWESRWTIDGRMMYFSIILPSPSRWVFFLRGTPTVGYRANSILWEIT